MPVQLINGKKIADGLLTPLAGHIGTFLVRHARETVRIGMRCVEHRLPIATIPAKLVPSNPTGPQAVIVGRSTIVGKPLAKTLLTETRVCDA